jgi:two-component system chemotaxis response regulator CheB
MLHMQLHRPDVILLDLEMPRMDGLTFLRQIMATDPIPVVILSSFLGGAAELSVRALEEGAVEIVTKPKVGARAFFEESMNALVAVLTAAASARPRRPVRPGSRVAPRANRPGAGRPTSALSPDDRVVVIGASTGGTDALRTIFSALPEDAPGIVAVQHMPARFTAAFADRLASECRMAVKEAEDGDVIRTGCALIAPGGRHSSVRRRANGFVVRLSDGEPVSQHRPSVDVLFRSAATAAGPQAVCVLLTGMGADGADGMAELRRAGACTLAQDEASCVIFGMPRAAIQRGAVSAVVPLDRMHTAILEQAAHARNTGATGPRWVDDSTPPAFGGQFR